MLTFNNQRLTKRVEQLMVQLQVSILAPTVSAGPCPIIRMRAVMHCVPPHRNPRWWVGRAGVGSSVVQRQRSRD